MSAAEIERFNKDVRENREMWEEIKNIGNSLEKIVAFAKSKGYEFTVADIEAIAKQSEELSEEQLDNVAGGLVLVASINVKACIGGPSKE